MKTKPGQQLQWKSDPEAQISYRKLLILIQWSLVLRCWPNYYIASHRIVISFSFFILLFSPMLWLMQCVCFKISCSMVQMMCLANLIRNLVHLLPLTLLWNNARNQMPMSIKSLGRGLESGLKKYMWKSPDYKNSKIGSKVPT